MVTKVQPSLTMEEHHAPSKESTHAQVVLDTTQLQATLPEMAPYAGISTPEFVLATPTPPRLGSEPEDPAILTPELVLATATPTQDEGKGDHTDEALTAAVATNASPESATPIFIPYMPALLPSPRSTPPRPPAARRKTLAGVTGFQLPRQSPRLRAKKRKIPIAKLAEQLLCRRMNIVAEGEQVTEAAIAKFAQMFQGQLPDIAVAALRALFQLDCDLSSAVEEALVQHGGEGGPDLDEAASATT